VNAPRGIRSVELLVNDQRPDTLFAASDDERVQHLTVERRVSLREGKNWMLLRVHDKAGASKDRAQFIVIDVPLYRRAVFPFMVGIGAMGVLTLVGYTVGRWWKRVQRLRETIEARTRELKTLQAQLEETNRKKSVDEIVEDLVKDINEPISSIHRNHDVLSRSFKKIKSLLQNPDDFLMVCENGQLLRLIEALERLNEENRAACNTSIRVVDNLRNLVVVHGGEDHRANVHDAIENTLALLQQGEEKTVEVLRDYGPVPDILFEPIQLNLVFMNVLANAFQEVGPRGQIHLKTFEEDGNVVVKVRYSRPALPERANRVFGTLAQVPLAEGPKLGLATVHKIIQDHQGKIFMERRDRNVKEFVLILPIRKEKVARLTEFEWS